MIYWNIERHLKKRGWANANQLADGAKLTKPAAYRIFSGAPLERIDVATLEALGKAFGCSPLSLLVHKKA